MISDAANWPAMGARSLAGYQPKKVWISDGAGRFLDVAQMVGATDRYDGRSVALADVAGRGVLDVIVANQKGPLLLYRNEVAPGRQWIAFDLQGGCANDSSARACTNRSAIGAQVELFWNGQQQVQEVSGGSGSARRTSAGCTSASVRRARSTGPSSGGRQERRRKSKHPPRAGCIISRSRHDD